MLIKLEQLNFIPKRHLCFIFSNHPVCRVRVSASSGTLGTSGVRSQMEPQSPSAPLRLAVASIADRRLSFAINCIPDGSILLCKDARVWETKGRLFHGSLQANNNSDNREKSLHIRVQCVGARARARACERLQPRSAAFVTTN